MNQSLEFKKSTNRYFIPVMFCLFTLLAASRRRDQLRLPQLWAEEGPKILLDYINHGIATFLIPVNGYYITAPKLVSYLAIKISFTHYPLVGTILSLLFAAGVGLAVALSPTFLRGKFLCALALFLVPAFPETFLTPLFTFWWASILLFLVALWNEDTQDLGWRLGFLILGGLSSPNIAIVLPVLYIRVWRKPKNPPETILAIVGTVLAFIQIRTILSGSEARLPALLSLVTNTIPTFLGSFVLRNWVDDLLIRWLSALGILGVFGFYLFQKPYRYQRFVLFFLLASTIALTIARLDPAIIHPILAGPRYFFLTSILIYWGLEAAHKNLGLS